MDTQSELWRTAALTALDPVAWCASRRSSRRRRTTLVDAPELLEENRFRAARDGVRAELLDPRRAANAARSPALAELAVEACRPHARELGCERELDLGRAPRRRARLTTLQRALAGPDDDLPAVVAGLSQRFTARSRSGV